MLSFYQFIVSVVVVSISSIVNIATNIMIIMFIIIITSTTTTPRPIAITITISANVAIATAIDSSGIIVDSRRARFICWANGERCGNRANGFTSNSPKQDLVVGAERPGKPRKTQPSLPSSLKAPGHVAEKRQGGGAQIHEAPCIEER